MSTAHEHDTFDGVTLSSWYPNVHIPVYAPLTKSTDTDVCIVGAGIAGLTTAYLLASAGKRVVVLDQGPIGSGQTGRTSAHLASAIDDRFFEIERQHGQEASRLTYESHAAAIDTIERIAKTEHIDCDFKRLDGILSAHPDAPPDILDRELAAAQRAGFTSTEILPSAGIHNSRALRFPNQARFHPLAYLVGLATAIKRLGGHIHTGRRVKDVQGAHPIKAVAARATLDAHTHVSAEHIVVATNTPAPINDWMGIYTKQAAYRTYVVALTIPPDAVPDALYWDTGDPYHYVRLQPLPSGETLLLVGGEDHKTGQFPAASPPFLNLETWARHHYPLAGEVRHRWSGQVQESADGLAFIGHAMTKKENVFVATGDSGMGLTHGTIAGLLITDQILGKPNPWEKLYDPSRKTLNTEFLSELANTVSQYKDLVTPGEVSSAEEIPKGQGAILRDGLSKLAVYRDDEGRLHKHSALCTHLGCVVQWNPVEHSWDCPCHGSRFACKGKAVLGPAITDLSAAK